MSPVLVEIKPESNSSSRSGNIHHTSI